MKNNKIISKFLEFGYNILDNKSFIVPIDYPENINTQKYVVFEKNGKQYGEYIKTENGKTLNQIIFSKKIDDNNYSKIYLELY